MSQLTLSFFGTFEALLGDKPLINFRSAKVQGILIYLALHPEQAHGRDGLAALFWPDDPETVAKHNLRQSLYRLRQLLGDTTSQSEPYLLVTRSIVQFNGASGYGLDVTAFTSYLESNQLEQAVALYQGDLLPGFSCDSLPFDEWLRTEREKLHRLALDALFELTARSLAWGDYQKAQRLARQQLALEPWREEAHRQLMQALALFGDRSGALAQYEICRRVLEEELGIEPATTTQALAARIRDQQFEQQAQRQPDSPRRLTTPFVGRHREYETLVKAYRQASGGTFQVVSLVGKAGIGKTRLAQQFLTWAATQGADVLVGRSFETSAGLSYQPLTHLLRQRVERENAPDDLLSDLWLSQLTRLLPELRDRYPDLPEPTQEENTARQHLFEAIARLGQALAERRPLVLFIDDWHWADTASLDVLQYAVQRWTEEKAPILVLLTLRQEALAESPDLQSWLNQLKRTVLAAQLNLGELSQAETAQLVQALLSPAAGNDDVVTADGATQSSLTQFSHWLFAETDGQPLFLTEALKVLAEDRLVRPESNTAPSAGSGQAVWQLDWSRLDAQRAESRLLASVREIIQSWLTRLSVPAVDLLTATAVLAQAASFDNLCRVSGLDETQAVAALDDLLNRQLLLETDDMQTLARDPAYTFSHQKVSEVIYAEAGTARRRMLHRRAFEVLQAAAAPASEIAHHALNAGLLAETIRYSLIAANDAMALFAVRVAITHYETVWQVAEQKGWPEAVSGADRQALYTGLGRAYELIESWHKAQSVYQAMVAYAQSIESTAMECLGLNHLTMLDYLIFNNRQQASARLECAQTIAEQSGDRRGMAETVWNLAMAAYQAKELDLALHHAEQGLDLTRDLQHPQFMARHLSVLAYIYTRKRQWDKVEAYAAEASRLFTDSGNLVLAADSQRLLGFSQIQSGKLQESLTTLQETAVFSRQIENLWGQAECARMLAHTHLELGNYGDAIRLGRQAVEQCRRVDHSPLIMWALATWGTIQRTLMAFAAAQNTLLELLTEDTDSRRRGWAYSELCAVHALAGEWSQAHGYARHTFQAQKDEFLLPIAFSGWYETEALLRGGDGSLSRAEVEGLGRIVGDNKRHRLPLLRSQAVLAQWDGDVAQAISHLQAALALAREIGLPGEEWSILGALGALYAEQSDQAQAQQAYKASAAIILRLAETIDEEDLRTGFVAADPVRSILEISEAV
jgi:DNA-binding SARP family transcriptional activator/predicted ATPase